MEKKSKRYVTVAKGIVFAILAMAMILPSNRVVFAAGDMGAAQGLVDRARVTFADFMRDPNYVWLHQNLDHAKGVVIFPQVLKAGFILGGSGGTGVFLVRDEKGNWSQPAFYTLGSVTFGLQIGGEAAEVIMMAMTDKAVDSLLSSSFKLGGDASVAFGPVGGGAKANASIPQVAADFISFARSKGLYVGLNLEGAVVKVRNSLNKAYYGKAVTPAEIVVKKDVKNSGSADLRATLKKAEKAA